MAADPYPSDKEVLTRRRKRRGRSTGVVGWFGFTPVNTFQFRDALRENGYDDGSEWDEPEAQGEGWGNGNGNGGEW